MRPVGFENMLAALRLQGECRLPGPLRDILLLCPPAFGVVWFVACVSKAGPSKTMLGWSESERRPAYGPACSALSVRGKRRRACLRRRGSIAWHQVLVQVFDDEPIQPALVLGASPRIPRPTPGGGGRTGGGRHRTTFGRNRVIFCQCRAKFGRCSTEFGRKPGKLSQVQANIG